MTLSEHYNVEEMGIKEVLLPAGLVKIQNCSQCGKKMLSAFEDTTCMQCEWENERNNNKES